MAKSDTLEKGQRKICRLSIDHVEVAITLQEAWSVIHTPEPDERQKANKLQKEKKKKKNLNDNFVVRHE